MDPLSVTASVIAVMTLSGKVLEYLMTVKGAPKECIRLTVEASNMYHLLIRLKLRLESSNADDSSSESLWFNAIQNLATKNGPLEQFMLGLEALYSKLQESRHRKLSQVGDMLVWKFKKDEVEQIIRSMERLKTLVIIALEMDHL
jgi:hypothetical protein